MALLTVHEVAKCLRIDDSTVRRWVREGILPAVPLPSRGRKTTYRFRQAAISELLNLPPDEVAQGGA